MDKIICLDGPGAAGKGSVAAEVAKTLKWHLLLSGTIYRSLAMEVDRTNTSYKNLAAIIRLAKQTHKIVRLSEEPNIEMQSEHIGAIASILSSYPKVRLALLAAQRSFYRLPGLVAEGRDMGSVVFPQAGIKIYLTADIKTRAARRIKQLSFTEDHATIDDIIQQLKERDYRDMTRTAAPLAKVQDAISIDSTSLTISEIASKIIELAQKKFKI